MTTQTTPTTRPDYRTLASDILRGLHTAVAPLNKSTLGEELLELCNLRASQMNGCALCVDLHARTLRASGTDGAKVDLLAVWREAPGFSPRERAALAWTEALTHLRPGGADDPIYAAVAEHFTPREQVELTHAIAMINVWNRFNAAFHTPPMGKTKAELLAMMK